MYIIWLLFRAGLLWKNVVGKQIAVECTDDKGGLFMSGLVDSLTIRKYGIIEIRLGGGHGILVWDDRAGEWFIEYNGADLVVRHLSFSEPLAA